MEVIQLLQHYVKRQESLVSAFIQQYPIADEKWLYNLPRNGVISLEEATWRFSRHGLGVLFQNTLTKEEIDPHVCLLSLMNGIDSWRLLTYFTSRSIVNVEYNQRIFGVQDQQSIENLLNDLSHNEVLYLRDPRYKIYTLW